MILTGETEVLGEKHYTASVVDDWMSMEQWRNDTDRGYWSTGRSACPSANLFTINPTWTCMEVNPCLRNEGQRSSESRHTTSHVICLSSTSDWLRPAPPLPSCHTHFSILLWLIPCSQLSSRNSTSAASILSMGLMQQVVIAITLSRDTSVNIVNIVP